MMITVRQAGEILKKKIDQVATTRFKTETIPLAQALGRVVASPVGARLDAPLFDNAAMDGFAVKSEDTKDPPVTLKIIGETKAGDAPGALSDHGLTVRIMTGAPIPSGADAVVPKEMAEESAPSILIKNKIAAGTALRHAGEDFRKGETVLSRGVKITPGIVGLAASMGIKEIEVIPAPLLAVLITGNELASSPADLKEGQIIDSNSIMLRALLAEIGIVPSTVEILYDDRLSLETAVSRVLEHSDIVIITGGVSVGDSDFTKQALSRLGVEPLFWKVAQKPGKPLYVGTKDNKIIFGLPGNPFAVFVCFYLYVRPTLLTLMGYAKPELQQGHLRLADEFCHSAVHDRKTHFLKGKTIIQNDEIWAFPLDRQGSHLLGSLREADILIEIPGDVAKVERGEKVRVFYL